MAVCSIATETYPQHANAPVLNTEHGSITKAVAERPLAIDEDADDGFGIRG